jgi:hypothetical protein
MTSIARRAMAGTLALCALPTWAATSGVYHPYVNDREREIDYGVTWRGVGDDAQTLQRASVGYAWSDDFSTELYLLSEFPTHGSVRARGYELEAKWQLTEQGEFAADWGLLVEAEVGKRIDQHEVAVGLLWEKELGHRLVATANAIVEYEFGGDVGNEFETALRAQLRYLHAPAFEPAFELHLDDEDYAAGPVLLGAQRVGPGRQMRWELGAYAGLARDTPDLSVRASVEFEF